MKKVIAIFLLLTLLASNLGFALTTHYCGGMAIESQLVFGHEELSCGMTETKQTPCHWQEMQDWRIEQKPCCQNEFQSLVVEDDFKSTLSLNTISLDFIAVFLVSYLKPVETAPSSQMADYDPPPLEDRDILALFQVFII